MISLNSAASTIQGVKETDLDAVWELLKEVYDQSTWPIGGRWTRSLLQAELSQGKAWGLWQGEQRLLALVLLRVVDEIIWEVTLLATDPRHMRKGLMQSLMKGVLEQQLPRVELWLEVHEKNNPARRLYEKLGFIEVGRRPQYYRDGGGAILYSFRDKFLH